MRKDAEITRPARAAVPGEREPAARGYYPALFAILCLALALRVWNLAGDPPGFFADEASIGYNAYLVLHTGHDEHGVLFPIFFQAFGEYKSPLFIYACIPATALLGLNELAVRLTAALIGVATVALAAPLGARLCGGRRAGLLCSLCLAISPWHVQFSRIGFEAISMPAMLALGLLLWLRGMERPRWLIAAIVCLTLGAYSYYAARVIAPLLLLALAVIYHRELWRYRRHALVGALAALAIAAPLIAALLTGQALARADQVSLSALHQGRWETVQTFLRFYAHHFGPDFLFVRGSEPNFHILRHSVQGIGPLYWWQLPLLVPAVILLPLRHGTREWLLLACTLLYPVGGALAIDGASTLRSIFGCLVFALLTAYGAEALLRWIGVPARRDRAWAAAGLGLGAAAVLVIALWTARYADLYFNRYRLYSAGYWGWQAGPRQALAYWKTVRGQYDQFVFSQYFNAPTIFFRFYAPDDCANCVVGSPARLDDRCTPSPIYGMARRQLFAISPYELSPCFRLRIRHTIYYPDGSVDLVLAEATPS